MVRSQMWCWRRTEKIKWSEKVTNEHVLDCIGEKRTLINNNIRRKANWIGRILSRNSSWCHWRTDDGSERSRKKKKNTAPRWFEKQEKMEKTVYQSNTSIFHKSLDLLISNILNNNNIIQFWTVFNTSSECHFFILCFI